jgi:hypothetical protein
LARATGIGWGYLLPTLQPDRSPIRLSFALSDWFAKLTVVQPEPEPEPKPDYSQVEPILADAELGRMCICVYRAAEFRIWSICRHLTREVDGAGAVSKKALRAALERFKIDYTSQHLNAILRAGNGLFWNLSKQSVFIRSRQYVAFRLVNLSPALVSTNKPGIKEVYLSPAGSLQQWEAMVYAGWLTYREAPTISRQRLEELFNRDQNTLRRWEQDRLENIITITPNYAQCHDARELNFLPGEGCFTYTAQVFTASGVEYVTRLSWRMPNTYQPSGIRQHPRKGQAQKVRSSVNRALANPLDERHEGTQIAKRYFTSGDSLRVYIAKHQTIGYLWRGRTKHEVGIWEPSTDGFGVTRAGERLLKKPRNGRFL